MRAELATRLYVGSEVGTLRRVVLHRPDLERSARAVAGVVHKTVNAAELRQRRLHESPPDLRGTSARRNLNEPLCLREPLVRFLDAVHHVKRKRRSATCNEDDNDEKRDEKFLHDRLSR